MKPTQVMIVEDEALVGIDIQDNLINYGYNVVGISNTGESALENAAKTRPEVILMDIQLKGKMNGIDAAKQIKQFLDIPIIYLTAYADDKTLSKALEASPSGYLLKPFVPNELHTTIQTALKRKNNDKENKLNRLRYIQKNILKQKQLKLKLEQKEMIPEKISEQKLDRLKYLKTNIEKRKLAEKNLQQEMDYRNTLEKLIGNFTFFETVENYKPSIFPLQEIATILGYTKDEIIRMGNLIILLLIHPEDFQIIEEHYKFLVLNIGKISEIEFRLKHNSGVWRWFSARSIYNKQETTKDYILHSIKDITWLKNLQYTSHISREKFVSISNNPYFGIAILDTDGKILNLNPTLEHLTGYTKEDLNWLNFPDYIGMKELRSICQNFEKLKSGAVQSFQTEVFIYTKNNKGAFWGYVVFNAIYNPDRNLDRIVCTLVDISESKLFEKKTTHNK